MKKHYISPEVEAFLLSAQETVASQNGISPLDDSLEGETGTDSSIFQ